MQYAQYPYMNHIAVQLDAAINPGNSGGPILFKNKIVGIAFQVFKEGEGLGYMIHTDIIKHFLSEVKSGEIKGFGSLCIAYQTLQSADARKFLKMEKHHSGVMIAETFANADSSLKEGDVILSVDGFKILNNGNVVAESGENVSFGVITDRKRLGDTVNLRLLRDGREIEANVELKSVMHKIAPHYYNKSPEYLLVGGFVFTKLSLSLLDEYRRVPDEMSVLFSKTNSDADEETIVLAQTLGDVSTEGYKGIGNLILKTVNGKKVKNLKELANMYDSQKEGFFIMESHNGIKIIVDIKNLKDSIPRIMKNYKISSERNL
ncbi:MAG: PDZ domain-containing protein [Opitutales bacterium]|nr:PDZ domain-containing protein [Opitutales bacterium]